MQQEPGNMLLMAVILKDSYIPTGESLLHEGQEHGTWSQK